MHPAATLSHLCVAPLLLPDEHEGHALDAANPAHNGRVVEACAVAMQLHKLVSDVEDDVQAGGPVGVAGDLQPLDWRQAAVGLLAQLQGAWGDSLFAWRLVMKAI